MHSLALATAAPSLLPPSPSAGSDGASPGGKPLPLSPAGEALLSFSLCNADPDAGGHYVWDFQHFARQYLEPVVEALSPVMALGLESQVILGWI